MAEKGIILYKSKYGSTKKYAQWLAEATGFPCVDVQKAAPAQLAGCGTVVLCGGVYASGIAGLGFLKKNAAALSGKRLLVLAVGASPTDEKAVKALGDHNLTGPLSGAELFYARGAWDEGRMTFMDRTMCKMLQRAVAKKDKSQLEPWAQALLSAVGQSCDWTDKKYLSPLLLALQAA